MTFQQKLNRNFTTGFPGDVIRNGPHRAQPARIVSATLGADGISTNRISRAFGYAGEQGSLGHVAATATPQNSVYPAVVPQVVVGGANFFGILGHPKHYALYGGTAGALSPTMDLPQGVNAEFFDMCTGLVVEIFNPGTAAQATTYGWGLAYVSTATTAAQNALSLPLGAIVAFAPGAAPAGFTVIPNAFVQVPAPVAASAAGALVSTFVVAQLTQ